MDDYVERIQEQGYCVVPGVYGRPAIDKALGLIRDLAARPREHRDEDLPPLGLGCLLIWNLQYKHPYFLELMFSSKEVERILIRLLNDTWYKSIPQDKPNYILRTYAARSSIDALPLHIDSFVPYTGDTVIAMQHAIILEDMGEANGGTLVVPGSHKAGEYVQQTAVKDAIPIDAKAGDAVVWDSRIWHGATANPSGETRWALFATFNRWWIKQSFKITEHLPREIYDTLSDQQKAVLGFCSIPYGDESEGVDMRRGYEALERGLRT